MTSFFRKDDGKLYARICGHDVELDPNSFVKTKHLPDGSQIEIDYDDEA